MTTQPNLSRLVEQQAFVSVSHSTLGADFFEVFMGIEEAIKSLKGVSGIYQLRNTVSGKTYVGKGVCTGRRLKDHIRELRKGAHINPHLQASFDKHGEAAFEVSLITAAPLEDLSTLEIYWIKELKAFECGYNNTIGGEGAMGHVHTEETKMKMSKVAMGHSVSQETRAKMSAARTGRKITFSAEHRANLSKAATGQIHSPEAIEKTASAHRGKAISPEHRAKISATLRGREFSPETRAKISAALQGHKCTFSAEHRAKISATLRGRKRTFSAEHCASLKKAWEKRKNNGTSTSY